LAEQEVIKKFIDNLEFDMSEYLDDIEVSENQNKLIEEASSIMKENIVGEVKKYGGNLKKNAEKFENFIKEAEKRIEEDYKDFQKELSQMFKDYAKKLRKLIEKSCIAIIPVKEMPWVDILFRSTPRITIENKKANLTEDGIAFYGEIKCVISRTTIYGKMKDAEPLFAPLMGDIDLGGYKLDESQKSPKSQIHSYINAVIDTLDASTTRLQLAKYHEGYQRHGEPICDFLMNKKDLLDIMNKIRSGLESSRIKSNIAVCGISIPLTNDGTSLILVADDGAKNDTDRYVRCFESFLNFSAACCEAPKAEVPSQQPGGIRSPGGQEMKEWTAEELAAQSQQRGGGVPPGMEVWTEEELQKASKERGAGIPEGMEVWTEDELQELSRKRQGGLDIPEWTADDEMPECQKCGYSLRKGWSECPICGTLVGAEGTPTHASSPESETDEIKEEEGEEIEKKESSETHDSSEDNDSNIDENKLL